MDIIDIFDFIQKGPNGPTKNQIQEKEFIAKVKEIAPNIVAICICYSHLSKVHLMLEKAGILAKERLERDFQLATKGKCISLDEVQQQLLYTMAEPDHITKTTIIHGPEGSGKSLLALEIVKMKLTDQLLKQGVAGKKIIRGKQIRVLLCGTYQGEDRVPNLLRQLIAESEDIKDRCVLKVRPVKDLKMSSPKEFRKSMKKIVEEDGESYSKTIIMLDEVFPDFTTEKWKEFQGIDNADFVLALRHAFNDGLCLKWRHKIWKKETLYQDVMEQQGVEEFDKTIICHLRMSYRCTLELISLAYYMLIHSPPEEKLYKTKSFFHLPNGFPGEKPLWIEVQSVESFIHFTNTDENLKEANDVMVIYDSDNVKDVIQTLRGHCLGRKWRICASTSVMGSEAPIVIIYDMKSIHFEAISRAVLKLIFVTTKNAK
mgnify:FL=1